MDRRRKNRLKIVIILFFFVSIIILGQDKKVNEDQKLREEILAVYQSEGEQGLLDFVKKKKDKISNKFIIDFVEAGVDQRKEEWLKVCEIITRDKKDEKTLADVFYNTGEYFRLVANGSKAAEYLNKALPIYLKLKDSLGQGHVYESKGNIYFHTGDYSKALEMYDKAMTFYEKTGDPIGQGNVYLGKGNIYSHAGDNSKAIEMYDKAMLFFEKTRYSIGLGNVYLDKGEIYFYTGNNLKALEMYNKAMPFFKKAVEPVGQGNVYHSIGDIYFFTGDNVKALEMYDKGLFFFKKARSPIGQGNTYWRKGELYFYTGDNSKAMEMYDKALPFFKTAGQPVGQGNIYWQKGDIYFNSGDNSKASIMFDKALTFFKKAGEPIGQGNVYLSKGDIYMQTGKYSLAKQMYDKALNFFEKAKDPRGKGNVYHARGNIYFNSGDNAKALEMYNKALSFFEKVGQPISQGSVYHNIGNIYFQTGENLKAIEMYDKAMNFYEKAGYIIGQGSVYKSMGDIYLIISQIAKAIVMYNRALNFYEKAEDIIGIGNIYQGKGDIYLRIGENSRAILMYDKALHCYDKAGYTIGRFDVYISLGDIYLEHGDSSSALKMYNKALFFFEQIGQLVGQGNIYFKKGEIFFQLEENSSALKMYDKALRLFEKTGSPLGQGNVYMCKGEIYFYTGNNQKMIEMYNKALLFIKKAGDIDTESIAIHGKAKVLIKLGKKHDALNLFEEGITKLEKVRRQTTFSEMKRNFLEKVYRHYEEAVTFMLENKYYQKGFKYAESMKSRVFLDRMAEELVRLDKGLKPDLKEKRDNLVAKLSSLNKRIYEAAGGKDEQKLQELKEQYRKTGDEFDELLIKIRLENPLYASVRYPEPITVQELQKKVLKKGEILVRYFISPNKLYVFLVSKKKFKVVPLDVKKEEIKGLVEEHLRAIKENNFIRMKRYGKILYEKLFKPFEKQIKKSKDIIIVPDRELATIPFESLIVDNKGQDRPVFLLGKYRIKYLQSASLLKILRLHYQNNRETNSFIGFGDPVYDYENFKQGKPEHGSTKILATESIFNHEDIRSDTEKKVEVKAEVEKGAPSGHLLNASGETLATESTEGTADEIKEIHRDRYARDGGIMDRLEASGEEVKTIARLFEKKSQKSVIHLREEATEDNASTPGMKDFDYIHFTCHGLLNDDFQSLVLSQLPPDKSKEDGYFTLNEIMNCDYNAKLVVLSACQTGSGKLERAEGVTGMTRAVMYAGTPAVVATLWKVDDEATKELMINFYRNMLEKNLDKAEALRQAKLELINNKKYRSPLFWSAFVMYGE